MKEIQKEQKLHQLRFATIIRILGKINNRIDELFSMMGKDHIFFEQGTSVANSVIVNPRKARTVPATFGKSRLTIPW
jgi:hypothetical protein